jgi:hypothetical protein
MWATPFCAENKTAQRIRVQPRVLSHVNGPLVHKQTDYFEMVARALDTARERSSTIY